MKLNIVLLTIVAALTLVLSISSTEALESEGEYFLDSENAYVIIGIDSEGNTELLEGSMSVNGEWQTWEDTDLIFSRVASDGEFGRFFGESNTGDAFYGRYTIGEQPTLFVKIWTDDNKVKILEQAILQSLF